MSHKVEKFEKSRVEVTVDVLEADWKAAQEKAFKHLAENVEVKGFRKGKAPADLVKQQIKPEKVFNEAVNSLLPKVYEEVLKEDNLRPFARPKVELPKFSDKELQIKFIIITAPEVELGRYTDIKIAKEAVEVSDAEVKASIEKLLDQGAMLKATKNAAKIGDTVVIDFVGYVDGKAFEGGKAENHSLELGSNQFIPGFEEQLVGIKEGESKDVVVTFPEQYVPELAGKEATFKVTVHEVKEKELAKLDEEFVKGLEIANVKTIDDLRKHQHALLLDQKRNDANKKYMDDLLSVIRDEAKIEIADEIITDEIEGMKENLVQQLSQNGMNLEQYLKVIGQSENELNEKMKVDAIKNVRSILVLEKIAEIEKIVVEDADVDFEIAKIADQYKMDIEKVKEILTRDMARFKADIRMKRIEDFLKTHNN